MTSIMASETAAAACERQVAANAELIRDLCARPRRLDAPFAAMLARGSSDHAGAFAKVVFELLCAALLAALGGIGDVLRRAAAADWSAALPALADAEGQDLPGVAAVLPGDTGLHPALWAIAGVQSFHGLAASVARRRGRDPDRPPHLSKVTRTL